MIIHFGNLLPLAYEPLTGIHWLETIFVAGARPSWWTCKSPLLRRGQNRWSRVGCWGICSGIGMMGSWDEDIMGYVCHRPFVAVLCLWPRHVSLGAPPSKVGEACSATISLVERYHHNIWRISQVMGRIPSHQLAPWVSMQSYIVVSWSSMTGWQGKQEGTIVILW